MYCDENRWRFFCLLRIIQESGVYQLGVPQGLGDSSAPSTTDPLICGFCLVTTPNTRSKTVEQSIVTWMFAREFITNCHRTDRPMDRHRQWQYPFSLKGHGVKMMVLKLWWRWNHFRSPLGTMSQIMDHAANNFINIPVWPQRGSMTVISANTTYTLHAECQPRDRQSNPHVMRNLVVRRSC